jgi:hypothetical protein
LYKLERKERQKYEKPDESKEKEEHRDKCLSTVL